VVDDISERIRSPQNLDPERSLTTAHRTPELEEVVVNPLPNPLNLDRNSLSLGCSVRELLPTVE